MLVPLTSSLTGTLEFCLCRVVLFQAKKGSTLREKRAQKTFRSLSFSFLPCSLLSNQPSPWTQSHAQWTQTTWPIEHPTDCVISEPLNQKQTDWGNFAFWKRLGQIEKTYRATLPLALPLTLILSHVLSLSVCWTSRVKDSQHVGFWLSLKSVQIYEIFKKKK